MKSEFISAADADLVNDFPPLTAGLLHALGLMRRLRPDIRARWNGAAAPSSKHAVYVHYDRLGRFHDYVVFQLRCFAELGYAITLVTNSPVLPEQRLKQLLPLCRAVLWGRNRGYDFAAYRDGLNDIPNHERCEQIILTNDSAYGPLFPLEEYLSRCTPDTGDIWSMTDNHSIVHHLQSYFLLLYPKAIMSPELRRFWRLLPDVGGKKWAVLQGEFRLSRTAAAAGLRLRPLFASQDSQARIQTYRDLTAFDPAPDVVAYREFLHGRFESADALNPTVYFADILIERERFPFLKRNMFLGHGAGVPCADPGSILSPRFPAMIRH